MIELDAIRAAEAEICTGLRQLRTEAGLTQVQLAVRAGTNQAVIQKIESGHSQCPRILADLACVLKVNPAWLQFGEPFAYPKPPLVVRDESGQTDSTCIEQMQY
ncbi:MAG: helix-turn-helix transcriptional regulator [Candidatus Sedimenticola sp. (ex Thyasira tokunagai)]